MATVKTNAASVMSAKRNLRKRRLAGLVSDEVMVEVFINSVWIAKNRGRILLDWLGFNF